MPPIADVLSFDWFLKELSDSQSNDLPEKFEKIIISNPRRKDADAQKIVITPHKGYYLLAYQGASSLTHQRIDDNQAVLAAFLDKTLAQDFKQLNAWTTFKEYTLLSSKRGLLTLSSRQRQSNGTDPGSASDKTKKYLLPEGFPIPPLVDLGVFTKEGKVAAPMQAKYRQINRFLEMLTDVLETFSTAEPLTLVDYGCGKSYLTFIVYYYLTVVRGFKRVEMTGLDLKTNVVSTCNAAARKYGYEGLRFEQGDLTTYGGDGPVDMVISLHACDTATDYALFHGLRREAKVIMAVPCCQHELNEQLESGEDLALISRYGIVKERTAALFTDAIRANLLAYCGYRTQLMEFVDLTHTPKNLLIRAVKTDIPLKAREQYWTETDALCRAFHLKPKLRELIGQSACTAY